MDYFGIIKEAYKITIKNKFLWIFGILAAGLGGASSFSPSFNYQSSAGDTDMVGQTLTSAQFEQKLIEFWANYGNLMIIGAVIVLLVSILFFIFGIISQGALIGAVDKIDNPPAGGEKTDFKTGFKIGVKNFWRIWGVGIIYLFMILASLCLLIIPVCLGVIAGSYVLAIGWGMLMLVICIIFWILITLIAPYSTIVVVLDKLTVWESIRESLHLFRRKWVSIILMYLILMLIGFAYGMAILLAFLIIGAIIFAVGAAIWLASMWSAIVYGITLGLILIIALVIINGAFKTFGSTVLVLTYNQLKKTV